MKFLIFVACFFGLGIVTILLQMAGFHTGFVQMVILYAGTYWIYKRLAKKWYEHQMKKEDLEDEC